MIKNTYLKVLVVEDDEDDRELLEFAMNKCGIGEQVLYLHDGGELLDYLSTPDSESVGIVLLDLNMPFVDGREALRQMKLHSEWKKIPVIVLTTSDSQDDIERCYALGAASYITKPSNPAALVTIVQSILDYWFRSAALPNRYHQ